MASRLGVVTKNEPSVSVYPDWDMLHAFPICTLLPEIQHWLDRCRGAHWPPASYSMLQV
ncbi:hypothetical protein DPMN_047113 [Dreissena polymorpha]|uniref:Uncharacterized protein n=1 Tax=Dreissena polymorpha TaxID=45954 RepID=A0A9D4I1J6_DREPO|nr:hypothetical protein DPMN_047113 [Dreissena polymorpha]